MKKLRSYGHTGGHFHADAPTRRPGASRRASSGLAMGGGGALPSRMRLIIGPMIRGGRMAESAVGEVVEVEVVEVGA